jgi:hypothetical protein
MSIVLGDRTVDISAMSQEVLIDVWMGISYLIYSNRKAKTCLPLTKFSFIYMTVRSKIE